MISCPINMPAGLCELCPYSKEGLCDYPYSVDMTPEEIKETTEKSDPGLIRGSAPPKETKVNEN